MNFFGLKTYNYQSLKDIILKNEDSESNFPFTALHCKYYLFHFLVEEKEDEYHSDEIPEYEDNEQEDDEDDEVN